MALQVFVSHAVADKDIALALQEWIRQTFAGGVKVFVSSGGSIALGADWRATIEAALKEADIVLVVCTQYSLSRPWIGFEAGAGWMNDAKVIPLCYHGVNPDKLPLPFSRNQGVDLGKVEHLRLLINLLVKDGQFDPQLIVQKPLLLPERKNQESESATKLPDVRVSVAAYHWGYPGDWKEIIMITAANHDDRTVYLNGGVSFDLHDSDTCLAVLESCVDAQPFYARELNPGQRVQLPVDPAGFGAHRQSVKRAFVTDEIGRSYYSTEQDLKAALVGWEKSGG